MFHLYIGSQVARDPSKYIYTHTHTRVMIFVENKTTEV